MYDDSNIITNTFFTELDKRIQCYGFISSEYNHDNENLMNSKNRLSFKIKHNIKKEFLMLQLEDILTPKKIETDDSKMKKFSILSVEKQKNMNIKDEFKIEEFQNFQQCSRINPINIQITDPEIQNKLLFYVNRYKYRFIANNLLFSFQYKKM